MSTATVKHAPRPARAHPTLPPLPSSKRVVKQWPPLSTTMEQQQQVHKQQKQRQTLKQHSNANNSSDRAPLHVRKQDVSASYSCGNTLPDYALLSLPRTNNYYAEVGGCPCIPRVPAHPGSWRWRAGTIRSTTNACQHRCGGLSSTATMLNVRSGEQGSGCSHAPSSGPDDGGDVVQVGLLATQDASRSTNTNNVSHVVHTRKAPAYYDEYGWRSGPHQVHTARTARHGKCDTFGNLAFKSSSRRRAFTHKCNDEGRLQDDLGSVSLAELADLEALILKEHAARTAVAADVAQLQRVKDAAAQSCQTRLVDAVGGNQAGHVTSRSARSRSLAEAEEQDLADLIGRVDCIAHAPLRQTNMERLHNVIAHAEKKQHRSKYMVSQILAT